MFAYRSYLGGERLAGCVRLLGWRNLDIGALERGRGSAFGSLDPREKMKTTEDPLTST